MGFAEESMAKGHGITCDNECWQLGTLQEIPELEMHCKALGRVMQEVPVERRCECRASPHVIR